MMKAVILAAGYGTRLQRDIEKDQSGRFEHLQGVAKPLLPVGDCALISRWLRVLTQTASVHQVFVVVTGVILLLSSVMMEFKGPLCRILPLNAPLLPLPPQACIRAYSDRQEPEAYFQTNALYYEAFQLWAQEFPGVQVLNDGTRNNEGRLGAVACLRLAVTHFAVHDDVVVIGGDTLFKEDFSLRKVTGRFAELQRESRDASLVLSYQCEDEETSKYGILEVGSDFRVQRMKEKPLSTETHSRRACPCFYLFSRATLPLLDVFLKEKEPRPLEERDAPGNFLSWLISRRPVYVHEISGRFDVGNLASYTECDRYFREQLKNPDLYLI